MCSAHGDGLVIMLIWVVRERRGGGKRRGKRMCHCLGTLMVFIIPAPIVRGGEGGGGEEKRGRRGPQLLKLQALPERSC